MRRERLKDQIVDPRVSAFDMIARALVIAIGLAAVYYALSGRALPFTRSAAEVTREIRDSTLTITATGNQSFYWNREGPFALAEFRPRLTTWLGKTQSPTILITADEFARLGDTVELLNEARRQGVADARLESRVRPTP